MVFTFISFLVIILALYIALAFRVWQIKKGILEVKGNRGIHAREIISLLLKKIEVVIKSALHHALFNIGKGWIFLSEKVKNFTFKMFPKLKLMFEEKDKLTGLYHGPASFFLANVSEYKTTQAETGKVLRKK